MQLKSVPEEAQAVGSPAGDLGAGDEGGDQEGVQTATQLQSSHGVAALGAGGLAVGHSPVHIGLKDIVVQVHPSEIDVEFVQLCKHVQYNYTSIVGGIVEMSLMLYSLSRIEATEGV